MQKIRQYENFTLPHQHGGIISTSFWRSAPISRSEAGDIGLWQDAMQECAVIALRLRWYKDIRKISNKTQKFSYEFWKKYGFYKKLEAKRASWKIREKLLLEEDEKKLKEKSYIHAPLDNTTQDSPF